MGGTIHKAENNDILQRIRSDAAAAAAQLAEAAHLHRGQIVVIGCSSSEAVGRQVGSWSTPEVGQAIYDGLQSVFAPMGVYIAAQCCEHLNRALIVEREAVPGAEIVNVVPQPKAGGSFATALWGLLEAPTAVEQIRAEEGNERYEYFFPMEDPETVLLIDKWRDQAALDFHHKTPMMAQIAALREKYHLRLRVERYVSE